MPSNHHLVSTEERHLVVEEVALRLHVSPSTVWRWVSVGRLHTVRYYGRTAFDREEVEALAAARGVAGT